MDKLNSEVGTLYVVYTEVNKKGDWLIDLNEIHSALGLIKSDLISGSNSTNESNSDSNEIFLAITVSHLGNDVNDTVKNSIKHLINKYPHLPILFIASSDNDKVITQQDVLNHVHRIKIQDDAEHNPNLN